MKKYIRFLSAVILAVMIILTLGGCSGDDYALMIGDKKISSSQYKAAAISIKTQYFNQYGLEESEDIWTQPITQNDPTTLEDYLNATIQSSVIQNQLYAIHFDELGLTLPDSVVKTIDDNMKSFEKQYGSKEEIDKVLKKQGFSYDEYEQQFYDEAKKAQVILHYFGPESKENPTSYEDMKAYYNEYYTKVKHIFFSTKDSSSNDFSEKEKAKIGEKANAVYQRALAGEDFEKLLDEFNEDPGMATSPDGYIFSTEDTSYTRPFHNAAFDMEFGEIRLVQSNMGYHIMKRFEFMTEEITDDDVKITLIENMMGSELADILQKLKDRIGVTYNNTVLTNLSVKNIKTAVNQESEEK